MGRGWLGSERWDLVIERMLCLALCLDPVRLGISGEEEMLSCAFLLRAQVEVPRSSREVEVSVASWIGEDEVCRMSACCFKPWV